MGSGEKGNTRQEREGPERSSLDNEGAWPAAAPGIPGGSVNNVTECNTVFLSPGLLPRAS